MNKRAGWVLMWLGALAQTAVGQIHGRILRTDGGTLAGVMVSATKQYTEASPEAGRARYAVTGADGGFAFKDLARGEYRVCAQAPELDLLGSCGWQAGATYTVEPGKPTPPAELRMVNAGTVLVRIDDADQLLARGERAEPDDEVQVGVWAGPGLYIPAERISEDSKGREHKILIPLDTPVRLGIKSRKVHVQDEDGKKLKDEDAMQALTVAKGEGVKRIKFKVVAGDK